MFLALRLLNSLRCGLGCVLGGEPTVGKHVGTCFQMVVEPREKYDARARWICPQNASRIIKEVAINCGWAGEARAGSIFDLKSHGYVSIHQSSRRDSPQCVV